MQLARLCYIFVIRFVILRRSTFSNNRAQLFESAGRKNPAITYRQSTIFFLIDYYIYIVYAIGQAMLLFMEVDLENMVLPHGEWGVTLFHIISNVLTIVNVSMSRYKLSGAVYIANRSL